MQDAAVASNMYTYRCRRHGESCCLKTTEQLSAEIPVASASRYMQDGLAKKKHVWRSSSVVDFNVARRSRLEKITTPDRKNIEKEWRVQNLPHDAARAGGVQGAVSDISDSSDRSSDR